MSICGIKQLFLAVAVTSIALHCASASANTDVVTFDNGDRLTGEFKRLERGKLYLKTDATDTISIDWDKVASLTSDQSLQLELEDGTRYFGSLLATATPNYLNVRARRASVELEMQKVVLMEPIESTILDRIDADVTLGYNYTQASDVAQLSTGLGFSYRDEIKILRANLNANWTTSENNESSQSAKLDASWIRLLRDRWLASLITSAERNDELGIDLRLSFGGGGGRFVRQTNHSQLLLVGGLQISREEFASDPTISPQLDPGGLSDNDLVLEGLGRVTAEWFRYDEPELDFSTTLTVYPSLSDWGRVRADLDMRLKWEIVSDLFWDLTFSNRYDSDPRTADAQQNDVNVRTSFGWEF
jgi:hypothetical protein